jgi:GH25 family lysozyme M1 (1,4-beta-N-acetylmuramidase)
MALPRPNVKVIDISNWQPDRVLNYALMKTDGIVGIIAKAGEGMFADASYISHRQSAHANGYLFDAYWFLRPGNMIAMAGRFVAVAQPDASMRLWADHEDPRVTLTDLLVFCTEVSRLTGRKCGIYSGFLIKQQLAGRVDVRFAAFPLWSADYESQDHINPTWSRATFWQCAGDKLGPWGWIRIKGTPDGIDISAYDGTDDALRAEWGGALPGQPAQPSPVPGAPLAHDDAWRVTMLNKLGVTPPLVAFDDRARTALLQLLINRTLGGADATKGADGWWGVNSQAAGDTAIEKLAPVAPAPASVVGAKPA